MSFKGIITKKDNKTGVDLLAKVISPNKKKSEKHIVPVSIKANELDDYSCCVIDLNTLLSRLGNFYDLENLTENISLSYEGANKTQISYAVKNVGATNLSDYFNSKGIVTDRPKYGNGDAMGYLEITVQKHGKKVNSRVVIIIPSISAQEALENNTITQATLWERIKGGNVNGWTNIEKDLLMVTEYPVPSVSTEPIQIQWTVNDSTLSTAGTLGIYSDERLDSLTGKVERCSYTDGCSLVEYLGGNAEVKQPNASNALQNYVLIGGLTLTATLKLGEATKDIIYPCGIRSKYITNIEVRDAIVKLLQTDSNAALSVTPGAKYQWTSQESTQVRTLQAPFNGGNAMIRVLNNAGVEDFEFPDLHIGLGQCTAISFDYRIEPQTSDPDKQLAVIGTALDGGFKEVDDKTKELKVDYAEFKNLNDADCKIFTIVNAINITGYSGNGLTVGGAPATAVLNLKFRVDTSSMS